MLGVLVLLALSTTVKSQIECTADEACAVDCSDASTNCYNTVINGTRATSLTVLCNKASACYSTEIYTPNAVDSTTSIQCTSGSSVCSYTEIHYLGDATTSPSTHSINIVCSTQESGCSNLKLYASNAGQVSVHCDGVECSGLDLFVENVDTIDLQCEPSSSSSRGCDNFELYANDASTLSILASGKNAIYSGEFHAENIKTSFELTCIGGTTSKPGCTQLTEIYPPENDALFTLNCYGAGCYYMKLHKYTGFATFSSANIYWNGCLQCPDGLDDCISKIYTYCTSSISSSFPYNGGCSYSTSCDECSIVYDAFYDAYTVDTSDTNCILPSDIIECTENIDCIMDCATQTCSAQTIDASLSSGLTLDCTVAEACKDTVVALPIATASTSIITCAATDACENLRLSFYGDASSNPDAHTIRLECSTVDDSCYDVVLDADKAGTVTFLCDGVECKQYSASATINANNADKVDISCIGPELTDDSSSYSYGGCNGITINAMDVTTSVTVNCEGINGCYNMELYAHRAVSVTLDINGRSSSYSGSGSEFYAEYADLFDITCYGGFDSQDDEFIGCKGFQFHVPATITSSNFKLNCYGKGCDDVYVLSIDGFASVTSDNFYINGCDDCKLNTYDIGDDSYCMDNLQIGCVVASISTTNYQLDTYSGYTCDNEQWDCGCAQAASTMNSAFTSSAPSDADSCSASLFSDDWEAPVENDTTVTVVIWILIIVFICCILAGYLRRFWVKNEWEKRKEMKDELQKEIAAGDTTKQSEYEDICVTTPDEYQEPEMKDAYDYGLYYGLDPFFNMFYDRWDKYFTYIGWFGEFIEIIVTLWIILSLLSPNAAFACCSYSYESASCDPAKAMGDDLSVVTKDDNGWCVVDGTPCVKSSWYDADDPTALFECYGADNIDLATSWNDEVCGADATKKEVRGNSAWIIVVLLFKLIKIGWDYYIQILEFKEKKRVAAANASIVAQYREKHPEWKPNTEKAPQTNVDADEGDTQATSDEAVTQVAEAGDNESKKDDEVPKDDDVVSAGPVLQVEKAIKICGFISTADEHWKKYYPFCTMGLYFLGVTLSVGVLAGLAATGGISITDCSYDLGDGYDSYSDDACYNIGSCANAGQSSSSTTSDSKGYKTVYAVVNKNVNLEGPQILAIFATLIGYLGYIPMVREKINQLMVKKGLKEAESEADEMADWEAWSGFL